MHASHAHVHVQGIPTTRAASVCTSKSTVLRDPFYSGNAIQEPCAVVLRVAPSFLRFGSLEIVKAGSNTGAAPAKCAVCGIRRCICPAQYWARDCLLYTSPSPRDRTRSRMPSSA